MNEPKAAEGCQPKLEAVLFNGEVAAGSSSERGHAATPTEDLDAAAACTSRQEPGPGECLL